MWDSSKKIKYSNKFQKYSAVAAKVCAFLSYFWFQILMGTRASQPGGQPHHVRSQSRDEEKANDLPTPATATAPKRSSSRTVSSTIPLDPFRQWHPDQPIKPRLYLSHRNLQSLVITRNVLIEFLPTEVLVEFFSFLDTKKENFEFSSLGTVWFAFFLLSYAMRASPFLCQRDDWNFNPNILFDPPDIHVENASAIIDQPSLVLTIGPPGSGKTTWAKYRYGEHQVFAADDYFDEFHGGEFVGKEIGKAHEYCTNKCLTRLFNLETVVVNNTNLTLQEMNSYVCAVIFGKLPHKIVFANFFNAKRNVDSYSAALAERNAHGVTQGKVKAMIGNVRKWRKNGPATIKRVISAGPFRRHNKSASQTVLYAGVFLDDESKEMLFDFFVTYLGVPLLTRLFGHHVTLFFAPTDEYVRDLPLGKEVEVTVAGLLDHELIQCAFVVVEDDEVASKCNNDHAHVTLASTTDVQPFYSNLALKYGFNRSVRPVLNVEPVTLFGRVGVFLKAGGVVFEL